MIIASSYLWPVPKNSTVIVSPLMPIILAGHALKPGIVAITSSLITYSLIHLK